MSGALACRRGRRRVRGRDVGRAGEDSEQRSGSGQPAWRADAAARFALAQAGGWPGWAPGSPRSTLAGLIAAGRPVAAVAPLRVITATLVSPAAGGGAGRRAHPGDRPHRHREQGKGGRQHRLRRPVGRQGTRGVGVTPAPGRVELMGSIVPKLQATGESRAATTRSSSPLPVQVPGRPRVQRRPERRLLVRRPRPPASLVRPVPAQARAAVGRADDHEPSPTARPRRAWPTAPPSAASTSSTTSSR